ncbi:MAG: hypothetical protein J5679_01960 [Alphaproteobacteria bacterium]|nr:hypothetical protein [Alphaproteobacteria bacterium]
MKRFLGFLLSWFFVGVAGAAELVGVAHVNMTSDTSQTAKTMAINDARRQILIDKLSPYAMSDQLVPVIRAAKSADLVNLISATSIDNEKISNTAYSAKITMTIDKVAARAWMIENEIQNWLNDGTSVDMFVAQINLSDDAIADWADLNKIMRNERIDITTKYINGKSVTVELPSASRALITIALRNGGWRTAAADDMMRIWK